MGYQIVRTESNDGTKVLDREQLQQTAGQEQQARNNETPTSVSSAKAVAEQRLEHT